MLLTGSKRYVLKMLFGIHFEKNDGSVAKLAAAIGMERTHLYRKLHALKV